MKNLGSNAKTILKLVRESLGGLNIPAPVSTATGPSALYNATASPYVHIGNNTSRVFVYGISEYGGDDAVISEDIPRSRNRYLLTIRGDNQ